LNGAVVCLSDSDGEDIGCEDASPVLISSADDVVAARSMFDMVTVTGQKHQDAYCKVCKTQHGVLLLTFILHDALKFELHVPRSGYC